jgi:hypothetical protein
MRALHGIIHGDAVHSEERLKRFLMLFDKLRLVYWGGPPILGYEDDFTRDMDYLHSHGVICDVSVQDTSDVAFHPSEMPISPSLRSIVVKDILVRHVARKTTDDDCDSAPVYAFAPWVAKDDLEFSSQPSLQAALEVGLEALPVPDETCALEDILEFKSELRDKQWAFRRFLKALATKKQAESEIRDAIEWTLNEYRKAMEIHHLKASQSFVDVFVISPLEIVENVVKFNWSKLAKGALSVKKRKLDLMEAEMKAPGKECAYVYDAKKRFRV